MAMTAWSAKVLHERDLTVGEWLYFELIDCDCTEQVVASKQRHCKHRADQVYVTSSISILRI
jgi:hypothetical protein